MSGGVEGLLEGLARLAEQLGHGVYRLGTPYLEDEVGIVLGGVTPRPGQLLALTPYDGGVEPDSLLPFDEPRLQWRVRGTEDESVSRRRAQALRDDLHGLGPLELPGGVLVLSIIALQALAVPLGRDDNGRHEHVVNTRCEFHNPTPQRPAQ